MAKRARPAQGANSLKPRKMPTNVKFSTYGIGATPHAKPVADGATSTKSGTPKIKRGGPSGGKRAPRDPGVRVTPLS